MLYKGYKLQMRNIEKEGRYCYIFNGGIIRGRDDKIKTIEEGKKEVDRILKELKNQL